MNSEFSDKKVEINTHKGRTSSSLLPLLSFSLFLTSSPPLPSISSALASPDNNHFSFLLLMDGTHYRLCAMNEDEDYLYLCADPQGNVFWVNDTTNFLSESVWYYYVSEAGPKFRS